MQRILSTQCYKSLALSSCANKGSKVLPITLQKASLSEEQCTFCRFFRHESKGWSSKSRKVHVGAYYRLLQSKNKNENLDSTTNQKNDFSASPGNPQNHKNNLFDEQYFNFVEGKEHNVKSSVDTHIQSSAIQEEFNEIEEQYFNSQNEDRTFLGNLQTIGREITVNEQTYLNKMKPLNEIDQQYFFSPETGCDNRRLDIAANKEDYMNHVESLNEFDKQYFSTIETGYDNEMQDWGTEDEIQNVTDTSLSETQVLQQYRRKGSEREDFLENLSSADVHSPNVGFDCLVTDGANLQLEREIVESENIAYDHDTFHAGHESTSNVEEGETISEQSKRRAKERRLRGTADPNYPSSSTPCSGCGALLHCNNIFEPGFMPKNKFKPLCEENQLDDAVCQRCWDFINFKNSSMILQTAKPEDFSKIVSQINSKKAFVLVMVDLLDFPCSIVPNLKSLIGKNKKIGIVGNKFDAIPKDSKNYENRIKAQLLDTCIKENVCNKSQVEFVTLISAKSGYNIETLITNLHKVWGSKGDIYLIGTANIGKSSLFNQLLHSDLIQGKAAWITKPATVSKWPGTTLNLIRFPIVHISRKNMNLRKTRLDEDTQREEEKAKRDFSEPQKKDVSPYVKGSVGQTFPYIPPQLKGYEEQRNLHQGVNDISDKQDPFFVSHPSLLTGNQLGSSLQTKEAVAGITVSRSRIGPSSVFYDTPGVLQEGQIFTHLSFKELGRVVPRHIIIPRTVIVKPQQVIFLGGLGRLDYIEGSKSIFFTVFASNGVPVRLSNSEEADEMYKQNAGEHHFRVPIGGKERMKTFPELKPKDFKFDGIGWRKSAADIILSSIGWVAVTLGEGLPVHVRAYTPNGQGLFLRQPALLPFAVNFRGKRKRKERFFGVDVQKFKEI